MICDREAGDDDAPSNINKKPIFVFFFSQAPQGHDKERYSFLTVKYLQFGTEYICATLNILKLPNFQPVSSNKFHEKFQYSINKMRQEISTKHM